MRRIILSSLFLSTVLLHGQTSTSAQSATLEARNNTVNSLPTDSDVPSHARPVSTGVTFPKFISGPKMSVSTTDFPTRDLAAQQAIVALRVDENGNPQNVHLVKSANQAVDARILSAVREYRFVPGSLDERNVPVDVNLVFTFQEK